MVWIGFFLRAPTIALLIAYIKGIAPAIDGIIGMFSKEPYLASYVEFACVGELPLALTLLCRDSFAVYSLRREGLLKSLLISSILVSVKLTARLLGGEFKFTSFNSLLPPNL